LKKFQYTSAITITNLW